jgi:hypothetical protein
MKGKVDKFIYKTKNKPVRKSYGFATRTQQRYLSVFGRGIRDTATIIISHSLAFFNLFIAPSRFPCRR